MLEVGHIKGNRIKWDNVMYLPLLLRILLIPQVEVVQLVVRIVLEADGGTWGPFGVLLCNTLLGNALELDLLTVTKLEDEGTLAFRIIDDRRAENLVDAIADWNKIAGTDLHDVVASTLSVKVEGHTAMLAVFVAVAVPRIQKLLDTFGVEWDQTQAVGNEFVGQNGAVSLDLDKIDGNRGNLGKHDATKGVGETELGVGELKLDSSVVRLE